MVGIGDNNYRNNIELLKVRNSKDKKTVMIRPIASISLIILILVAGVITCDETGGG